MATSALVPLAAVVALAAGVRAVWVAFGPPTPLEYDWANFVEAAARLVSSGYFAYGSGPIGTHA